MPLLYSESQDLAENELNRIKSRINTSALTYLTNVTKRVNVIEPTQKELDKQYFYMIDTLSNLYNQLRAVVNGADPDKIALDLSTPFTTFINMYQLKINRIINYFNPQQIENIKLLLLQLDNVIEHILFADMGEPIDNFLETIQNGFIQFHSDIDNYSPLQISLITPTQENPLLEGGFRHTYTYPNPRFL